MQGQPPLVGLNINDVESYCAAAGPLFEAGLVDALEVDVDNQWGFDDQLPPMSGWFEAMLDLYAEDDALYAHGVWLSLLTARPDARQARWLARLADECRRRSYRHLSEHFGFMTAGDLVRGTMVPVPFTPAAVRVGRDRLRRMADAAGVPVGLEMTAAALCPADALEQGAFLEQILAPDDGFLVFDVHNLWTQAHNLELDVMALLDSYRLERVRELHVSGGRWYETQAEPHKGRVRLDSHDGPVPEAVLALIPLVLARCPNLEVVIMENRGFGIESEAEQARYRDDFRRLRALVEAAYD
jgi:uncharacterized protein (UPF0276 family)